MIAYPENWKEVGQPVIMGRIEERLIDVIKKLNCQNLSLSGGIDSSLLLYFMVQVFGKAVNCFTIAASEDHPDYVNSAIVARYFGVDCNLYIPEDEDMPKKAGNDCDGDEIVKCFYEHLRTTERDFYGALLRLRIKKIVAGDGIDEFMGGYYGHMKDPSEQTYYGYLRQLQKQHLEPLHRNSGKVRVFLPYLDEKLVGLFSQIPLSEKFDKENRKKIVLKLAEGKIPKEIINRRKYGFCDAMKIK